MIQWPRLLRFKQDDVLDIPEGSRSLIDEGVYSISDTQYCLADVINENG